MTLLLFIIILSVLVFVHELGHFLMAKRAGIKVEEFGFGLPPKIWGKKVGETTYSINALPIGGFVKLYGENGEEGDKDQGAENKEQGSRNREQSKGKAYYDKTILQRLSVLYAGVTMNLILAIICFSVIYFFLGIPTKTDKILIDFVAQNSPAQSSGLVEGDIILSADNTKIIQSEQFIEIAKNKAGNPIILEVQREKNNPCKSNVLGGSTGLDFSEKISYECKGELMLISLTPRKNPPEGEGPIGVSISDMELKKYPFYLMPFYGIREGFKDSYLWAKEILLSLVKMVYQLVFKGNIPKDVAGPVGIYQVTGQVAKGGILSIFKFVGILSVNLAIMNVLPLPALDGGRAVFLFYEMIFKKKANQKVEATINQIGMMALLLLILLITVNDVVRLFRN